MPPASHITRYSVMPIAPVDAQTEIFEAGTVRVGVEYRLLDDAIAAAAEVVDASGDERGVTTGIDDRGVSLHVFAEQDGEERELLRFDCFVEDPHYHYVSWREHTNDMVHIDPIADGDPLVWALDRVRHRLPQMLERAGAPEVARGLDAAALEQAMPRITAAAFRARYEHDDDEVRRAALAQGKTR